MVGPTMIVTTTHRWLLLVLSLLPLGAVSMYGVDANPKTSNIAASRELVTDRTYRAYNSELNCVIAHENSADNSKFFPFEFYYAAEADTPETDFLPALEQKLFHAVSSHVFWCYGQYSTVDFGGRRLNDHEISQRELEIETARRLGIVSVASGGYDVATDGRLLQSAPHSRRMRCYLRC